MYEAWDILREVRHPQSELIALEIMYECYIKLDRIAEGAAYMLKCSQTTWLSIEDFHSSYLPICIIVLKMLVRDKQH